MGKRTLLFAWLSTLLLQVHLSYCCLCRFLHWYQNQLISASDVDWRPAALLEVSNASVPELDCLGKIRPKSYDYATVWFSASQCQQPSLGHPHHRVYQLNEPSFNIHSLYWFYCPRELWNTEVYFYSPRSFSSHITVATFLVKSSSTDNSEMVLSFPCGTLCYPRAAWPYLSLLILKPVSLYTSTQLNLGTPIVLLSSTILSNI